MKKFFSFLAVGVLSAMLSILILAIYQCQVSKKYLDELIPSNTFFTKSAKQSRGL